MTFRAKVIGLPEEDRPMQQFFPTLHAAEDWAQKVLDANPKAAKIRVTRTEETFVKDVCR